MITNISDDLNWLRTHILLLAVVGVLVFGGIYGVESLIAKHDANNSAKWTAVLQQQTEQTQALASKLSTDEANWSAQNAQYQATIKSLAQSIIQRDKAAATQIQQDNTLSAAEAANRLSQQTQAQSGEVTVQGNDVTLDLPITRQVIADLDKLPAVESDLEDTQKQLTAETSTTDNLQANLNEKDALIAAMKVQAQDADNSCKAQISDLKAQARKSKLKWSTIMLGIGVALAKLLGI